MKTLIKIATIAIALGTSTLFASTSINYAVTESFKLLNDMNLAKKQQHLILDISKALKTNHVDMESSKRFTLVLLGLVNGNKSLKLQGTDIPKIKSKLGEIQELWKTELSLLSSAKSNRDTKKAIEVLDTIMVKMNETILMYDLSYSRFRQKAKLSSVVYQHTVINNMKLYALNN